jgi:hypothetical protein
MLWPNKTFIPAIINNIAKKTSRLMLPHHKKPANTIKTRPLIHFIAGLLHVFGCATGATFFAGIYISPPFYLNKPINNLNRPAINKIIAITCSKDQIPFQSKYPNTREINPLTINIDLTASVDLVRTSFLTNKITSTLNLIFQFKNLSKDKSINL